MHEVAVAGGILDAVRAEAAARKPARAIKVGVRIGEMAGIDPESLWRQSDNVPFEQSRNVLLTAPSCGDAGRTTTDDASR